jgi:hypothetical protein
MSKKFSEPYIIFYPVVSRDGMMFPVNRCIQEIQGKYFRESHAWRGSIVIGKFKDKPFSSMTNVPISEYPLVSPQGFLFSLTTL